MQTINSASIGHGSCPCVKCGNDLSELGNFTYQNIDRNTSTYKEERYRCNKCGTIFFIHYDLFDRKGHIAPYVFSSDANDPTYDWQDLLSKLQRYAVNDHLKKCKICQHLMDNEILSDAIFAAMIHSTPFKARHN